MFDTRGRLPWLPLPFVGLVLALLTAGCGGTHVALTPGSVSPSIILQMTGESHEMLSDTARKVIWFPEFSGTELSLHQYSLGSGNSSTTRLGDSQASGIASHIRLAPDQSIWVSDDYMLYRYDPATEKVTSVSLPEKVNGALSGALDPSNPLPGTWVSAFVFDTSDEVLVARNNVPFLGVYSDSGNLVRQMPLPAGVTGPSDMTLDSSGLSYLASHAGVDSQGELPHKVNFDASAPDSTSTSLRASFFGRTLIYLTTGGQVEDELSGPALWTKADGTKVEIPMASQQRQRANPLGQVKTVTVQQHLTAAALDGDGGLWSILTVFGGGSALVSWQGPSASGTSPSGR